MPLLQVLQTLYGWYLSYVINYQLAHFQCSYLKSILLLHRSYPVWILRAYYGTSPIGIVLYYSLNGSFQSLPRAIFISKTQDAVKKTSIYQVVFMSAENQCIRSVNVIETALNYVLSSLSLSVSLSLSLCVNASS